jgi:hypothetical protein
MGFNVFYTIQTSKVHVVPTVMISDVPKSARSCVTVDNLQQQDFNVTPNKVISRHTHRESTLILPQRTAPGSKFDQTASTLNEVEEMVSPAKFNHVAAPANKFLVTAIAAAAQTNRVPGPHSMSNHHLHLQQHQEQQRQQTSSSCAKPASTTKSKKQSTKRHVKEMGDSDQESDSDRSDAKGRRKPAKRSKTSSVSSSAKNKALKEHCRALVAASDRDNDVMLRAIQHLQSRFEEGDDSVDVAQILEWGVHKRLTAMLTMRGRDVS